MRSTHALSLQSLHLNHHPPLAPVPIRTADARQLLSALRDPAFMRHQAYLQPPDREYAGGFVFCGVRTFVEHTAVCVSDDRAALDERKERARRAADHQREADVWHDIVEMLDAIRPIASDNYLDAQSKACQEALGVIGDTEFDFRSAGSDPASPTYARLLSLARARLLYRLLRPALNHGSRAPRRALVARPRARSFSYFQFFQDLLLRSCAPAPQPVGNHNQERT